MALISDAFTIPAVNPITMKLKSWAQLAKMPSVSLTSITDARMASIYLPRSQPPARINKVCTSAPSHQPLLALRSRFKFPEKKDHTIHWIGNLSNGFIIYS